MANNKMSDLRNHLFETLERLKDDEKPLELDRAKAIVDVAEQLIASARVEVDYIEATGQLEKSTFIDATPANQLALPPAKPGRPNGHA